ncbi:hypothetical protein D3C72_1060550 [compost metagenome]
MVAVREDIVLIGQVGAARIDQIDARQVVLFGNLLRAHVLLDRDRVVGAALDRGVVADDHAFLAGHPADAGDDAGARRGVVVHLVRGQLRQLQERRARIEQLLHAVARQQLAAPQVLGAGFLAAAFGQFGDAGLEVRHQCLHGLGIGLEGFRACVQFGFQRGHVSSCSLSRSRFPANPYPWSCPSISPST